MRRSHERRKASTGSVPVDAVTSMLVLFADNRPWGSRVVPPAAAGRRREPAM
jgi:hypothetical protein